MKSLMRFPLLIGLSGALAACTVLQTSIEVPDPLSPQDYALIRNELIEVTNRENPKAALALLRTKMEERPRVVSVCHALTHEVGHAAYDKYKGFPQAMQHLDELCNAGYMHGVIEHLLEDSPEAMQSLPSLCDLYRNGSLQAWECQHGIGHGLMFVSENDLPASLKGCDVLKTVAARDACRNGVFMENFAADDALHHSRFVSRETPRFPCESQADADKGNCYIYAPTYFLSQNPGSYEDALGWCLKAELQMRGACISGVGSEAMKQNIDDPDLVQRVCDSAGDFERECSAGMIDLAMRHYGSLETSQKFCDSLWSENRELCREAVDAQKSMFE
jgi:hypothetical protein